MCELSGQLLFPNNYFYYITFIQEEEVDMIDACKVFI